MNPTNFEKFLSTYEAELRSEFAKNPAKFAPHIQNDPDVALPVIVASFRDQLQQGRYNRSSNIVRATCKTLKIKTSDVLTFVGYR